MDLIRGEIMNTTQIELIVDAALEQFSTDSLKPTDVAKIVNAVLQVAGVEKDGDIYQIQPQMMYNYSSKGMIVKGSKRGGKDNPIEARYTRAEVKAFALKFITKQGEQVAASNLADVIRESLGIETIEDLDEVATSVE